jgi:hypothetical protein
MAKIIRTHLAIMYDELWTDLLANQYGINKKPNIIRHNFSWTKPEKDLKQGFKSIKPAEFRELDTYLLFFNVDGDHSLFYNYISQLILLADNRMKMGDYRYGRITRQNLDNYDTVKEFFKRLHKTRLDANLEHVVDAYNMLRIQYYKSKNFFEVKHLILHHFNHVLLQAYENEWPLISIDDGEHAQEK